ncbi:MAG TPA: hypothetical protein VLV55_02540 [Rhizomicrobium sp.]|nr:hypothetical protein [Rhizomicrobium sp.]
MRSQSVDARRARYLSSAAYARSRAAYAARLEDRLYWLTCAQSWEHHAAALPAPSAVEVANMPLSLDLGFAL